MIHVRFMCLGPYLICTRGDANVNPFMLYDNEVLYYRQKVTTVMYVLYSSAYFTFIIVRLFLHERVR